MKVNFGTFYNSFFYNILEKLCPWNLNFRAQLGKIVVGFLNPKKNMIPQIGVRRIGQVAIVDVKGSFTGTWALREKAELTYQLTGEEERNVILNLRQLESLDTLGARTILECIPEGRKVGLLGGNQGVIELMSRVNSRNRFHFFEDEVEAISAFGEAFLEGTPPQERRKSPRLRTALPLQFSYWDEGYQIQFHAVVTNLNEQGLYAEYIDLDDSEQSLRLLHPYDLKTLRLRLSLPHGNVVEVESRVVHRTLDGDQVGIGIAFEKIGAKEQTLIRRFLKR
ncbi:MAG: hypothetical protein A3G87_05510 [Omnitrophica bacterium RIFCSPLOWO2_12_FULL_50_11]|nr:MAG: hypothetical protein A3G87_05510 [Omnitrophica bacterium RIFCSPLOWO2_12_FULL_50_11]